LTLFSTINALGTQFEQMIVMKGTPNARIHAEITKYDDINTIHTCQEKAWCDSEILKEWHAKVWTPIAESRPGPKLLIADSYPVHCEARVLLSSHNTWVLFIHPGLTFNLQPLDAGYFKILKDELRKLWIRDYSIAMKTEKEKRARISGQLKEIWPKMNAKNLSVFWNKASLIYPDFEISFVQNHPFRNPFIDHRLYDSREDTLMTIEQDSESVKVLDHEDTKMTIEQNQEISE